MPSEPKPSAPMASEHMSSDAMSAASAGTSSGGSGWRTRPETSGDIAAVRAVNLAAFPTGAEADLVDALRVDQAWIPGLSIVTEGPAGPARPRGPEDVDGMDGVDGSRGPIVGHALLTRCRVDGAPALALAPVAVAPEYQRTGAGSAAVRAVLDAARELGEDLVLVLGHPDYYPRFGFTPASALGIRAPFEVPDEAMMALRLRPGGAPAPSGVIQYPAPFGV